jgi:hypothetical protein
LKDRGGGVVGGVGLFWYFLCKEKKIDYF